MEDNAAYGTTGIMIQDNTTYDSAGLILQDNAAYGSVDTAKITIIKNNQNGLCTLNNQSFLYCTTMITMMYNFITDSFHYSRYTKFRQLYRKKRCIC